MADKSSLYDSWTIVYLLAYVSSMNTFLKYSFYDSLYNVYMVLKALWQLYKHHT